MVSFQTSIIVVSILLPLLATGAVGLRFYAQAETRSKIHADDVTILLCLAIVIGIGVITVYGAYEGCFGFSLAQMAPQTQMLFAKLLFAHQFFWISSVAVVKISLLLFYARIFSIANFKLAAKVMTGLVVAWWIAFTFGTLFSTTPISAQWTSVGHYNLDYPTFLIASCTTDMVLDVMVLCLPLTVIRTLLISNKKKLYLSGIFGLGLFCTIASMVRLAYIVQLAKIFGTPESILSFITTDVILWSVIEPCISIITACLPLLGPLVKDVGNIRAVRSVRSRFGGGDSSRRYGRSRSTKNVDVSASGESLHAKNAWQSLDMQSNETRVIGGHGGYEMGDMPASQVKMHGIHVHHTTRVDDEHV